MSPRPLSTLAFLATSALLCSLAQAKDEWKLELPGPLESAITSPKGTRLVTLCKAELKLWDLDAKSEIKAWPAGSAPVYAMGETILLLGKKKSVIAMSSKDGSTRGKIDHPGKVEALAVGPKGKLVLTGSNQVITLWSVDKKLTKKKEIPWKDSGRIRGIAFGPKGKVAICTSDKQGARVLELRGKFGLVLKNSIRPCNDRWILLAGKGKVAITARGVQDPQVNVWDLANTERPSLARILHSSKTPLWYLYAIAVTSKGDRFYTATGDGKVHAWDLRKGTPIGNWQVHPKSVRHVALIKDKVALTIDEENVLRRHKLAKSGLPR